MNYIYDRSKVMSVLVILGLHYVPGGHGNHVSGHRGQNGMDVRQRGETEWANVTDRDFRGQIFKLSKELPLQSRCG